MPDAATGPDPAPSPTIDEVRVRAYEIFLGRRGAGDPVSDWLQAEQELMGRAS